MRFARIVPSAVALGFCLLLAMLNASSTHAQCMPGDPEQAQYRHASLLSATPTCTSSESKPSLSSVSIAWLPAGMFVRNPLVGLASLIVSRHSGARGVSDAVTRREDLRLTLRGGRTRRQVAW